MRMKWMVRFGSLFLLTLISLGGGCIKAPEPPPPPPLEPVSWESLEGWETDDPRSALTAFLESCRALGRKADWRDVCEKAGTVDGGDSMAVRSFFRGEFLPYRVNNPDGSRTGMITGYYVPELEGRRAPVEGFAHPLYALPEDMLVIDMGGLYPDLKNYRLRGRVEGRKVVPYYSRGEIDGGKAPLKGQELVWVQDPVELFFLHIQGSGRIRLENGDRFLVSYADQNGHPYRSIGKILANRGELPLEGMSMQKIRQWAIDNPERAKSLLAENPSYIFFRELPPEVQSPPGALGVPLTAERSLAVDRRVIPLGAPVFLSTTRPWPENETPLQRLMVAQDTGGAIKGAVRADFFWGFGHEAGELAGRMKQDGKMWVLLPKNMEVVVADN